MIHYSIQPRDRVYVENDRFLSFAKNMVIILVKI